MTDTPGVVPDAAPAPDPLRLTGGEAVARALAAHGVTRAFGIPGTHNLEIYRHLATYGIAHTAPRHEQGAGYAADAHARVTGEPGVAITTTGPALLNIAAAVGQAHSDSVPLLVVSPGMPLRHPRQATGLLHEMPSQTEALRNVAAFSHRVSSVDEIGVAVARAFTLFRTERPRPVHIEVPLDLLEAAEPVGRVRTAPPAGRRGAAPESVERAAALLARAERPALVLGGGARGAAGPCRVLAERLGAPVVTTANGKNVVDERHPLALGVSLHSPAVQKWLATRDVVLAIGTELAESDLWSELPPLQGRLIRVDIDPAQMYARHVADVPLVGDAAATLDALVEAVGPRRPADEDALVEAVGPRRPADEDAHDETATLKAARDDETHRRDARWLPYLEAIGTTLAPDAVVTSDSAQCCYYGALPHLALGPDARYLHPTGFGTLGYALPAAIGAKAARPDRQVVAISGDGGLQFTIQELATATELRLPLPVVVFDNAGYGEIRDEMAARGDQPVAVDHARVDLSALARAYGGRGVTVHAPGELAAVLARALTTPGPTLITVPEETA
ncbi:thiamine pyrophosphate-dependent enzyme [Streptomyces sp. VRA16 Mangrove soil]|uniref:thiamine pyrophosphate-dependent enzyme n=1 Tax=Streptomyces sp. VRA16 Mangrove soil TaxID=2817434 RepID=UPI001A9CC930|nr:thiamine pyrophosphate-dependent enzyme [Streptomyces sp. VRA16 Mangrove soil]MBO1329719.1 acetolactate synthase [Streptomyces sp. VRA16 Mangrove soil]